MGKNAYFAVLQYLIVQGVLIVNVLFAPQATIDTTPHYANLVMMLHLDVIFARILGYAFLVCLLTYLTEEVTHVHALNSFVKFVGKAIARNAH